jgi:hypothetical protein
MQALREAANIRIQFEQVSLSPPAHTLEVFAPKILQTYLGYGLGYRGMCRFFSGFYFL